jgi:predicted transposase YbfD/YdcC
VKVRRWGTRDNKPYSHTHYYILSKAFFHAQAVAQGIRNHWRIENNLHWVKDVIIGEDNMAVKDAHDASVVAVFNTIVLNILRIAGYKPTKDVLALFANKIEKIYKLLQIKAKYHAKI